MLAHVAERAAAIPGVDGIVLATTTSPRDDRLADWARHAGIECIRGSEEDVLGRVRGALDTADADVCVEITGDCPLTDPRMVSRMVGEFASTRGVNRLVSGARHNIHRPNPELVTAAILEVVDQVRAKPRG